MDTRVMHIPSFKQFLVMMAAVMKMMMMMTRTMMKTSMKRMISDYFKVMYSVVMMKYVKLSHDTIWSSLSRHQDENQSDSDDDDDDEDEEEEEQPKKGTEWPFYKSRSNPWSP